MADPKRFSRALDRFERAVLDRSDMDGIPEFERDAEEQSLIDEARRGIKREYGQARTALIKAAGFSKGAL